MKTEIVISDDSLRHILHMPRFIKRVRTLKYQFKYDVDDLIQEVRLYLVKYPLEHQRFILHCVYVTIANLMRHECGRLVDGRLSERARLFQEATYYPIDDPGWLDDPERGKKLLPKNFLNIEQLDWSRLLWGAMDFLTLRQWWVVVEHCWLGRSLFEIGRRFHFSEAWACQQFRKALNTLRQHLPPKGDLL